MKNHLLIILLLLFAGNNAFSQEKTVSGRVVDANGAVLPGVNVLIKGTSTGTVTDANGEYKMAAPNGQAILVFSFIGYTVKEVTIGSRAVIDVTLSEDVTQLGEVVVTALGIERNARTLTYSTQKLEGKSLTDVRDANFVNTLSGKVAGIVITQGAAGPGSATRVVLRGNRSIKGNNNALFVIDGVPVDNTVRGQAGNDFGTLNKSDGAGNFNPDDIESINVLKGPAASALYGSRAANGVIMITTKKGKEGKISADINSGVVFESPLLLPKLQTKYGQGAGGKADPTSTLSWGPEATTHSGNIPNFFRTGISVNNSIGISGGTDKIQTYSSYTHNNNQGILPNNDLARHTANLRINTQLNERFSTDLKITYINQRITNKPRTGEHAGVTMQLFKTPAGVNLDNYKVYANEKDQPIYWGSSGIYTNPYWTLNKTGNTEDRNRLITLGSITLKLTDQLKIQGRISHDWYADHNTEFDSNNTILTAGQGGSYVDYGSQTLEQNMDVILSGDHQLHKTLGLSYNVGTGLTYNKYSQGGSSTKGLSIANRFDLTYASALSLVRDFERQELQYVFGTATFNFKEYLTIDASVRNDWSSTLPKPYSYIYSAFGANFILSDVAQLPQWITFAKLRASWAQVGNDADPYNLVQPYSFTQGGFGGFIARDAIKVPENLKPEISIGQELGLDLRFFNTRLGIDFTYYNTNTVNQSLNLTLAPASGFSSQYINAGKINNKGFEFVVTATPVSGTFSWDISANAAQNINTIVELHPNIKSETLGGGGNVRTTEVIVREGGSYGDLKAAGWLTDGQGNYVINSKGVPVQVPFSNHIIGNFNPKMTFGLSNTFSYKGVSLYLLVDGRVGGVMVSGTDGNLAYDGSMAYTEQHRSGGWVLPGVVQNDNGEITGEKNTKAITAEQFWQTVSQGRYTWGEFFTYNTTNVRLRELTLGYNIPLKASPFIKNVRVSLTARNLFFIYRGNAILNIPGLAKRKLPFDPDVNLGAGNYQGAEYGLLPSTRTIGLNLKLGF